MREMPSGHVVHGPFPARLRYFGTALATSFLGVVFVLIGLQTERVVCPSAGMCTLDGRAVFDRSQLRNAHVERRTGSKGAKYGVVVLDLDGGGRLELTHVDPEQAEEVVARMRNAIANNAAIDETLHGPRYIAPFGIGGAIVGVVVFVLGLTQMGRFDLVVDGSRLKIRRSLYGVPLGTREVSIERVREVLVERGTVATVLRQRYEKEIEAARLHLVYESGEDVPLTRGLFPGHALHLHAASALRTALGIEPNARDDDELARIPMRKWDLGTRVAFAWIGVTTGSLLGLLVLGLSLLALGLTSAHANIEGWMLASGAGGGAIGGVALVFHWTRTRLPR